MIVTADVAAEGAGERRNGSQREECDDEEFGHFLDLQFGGMPNIQIDASWQECKGRNAFSFQRNALVSCEVYHKNAL